MYLSELFNLLSTGEFSNLYVGGEDYEGIPTAEYPGVINNINLALTDLHTRFPLIEKEVVIQQYDNITMYKLHSDFAEQNSESTENPKYIMDTVEDPFEDIIIRIERGHQEDGTEVPLNDYGAKVSWYTPEYNTIQIPEPVGTNTAHIIYRANHVKIPASASTDPDTTVVNLPYTFVNALLMYVAYRHYAGKPNQETQAVSASYYQKYETACALLRQHNVMNDGDSVTNTKLETNGWV